MLYKFVATGRGSEIARFTTSNPEAANMLLGALGFYGIDDPRNFCGIHSGYAREEADYTLGDVMAAASAIVVAINVKESPKAGLEFLSGIAEYMRQESLDSCTIIAY